jgi:hypothetical protein
MEESRETAHKHRETNQNIKIVLKKYIYILHDHPFQLGCTNVFSLAGDALSGNGTVHRITYSFSYFLFLVLFTLFTLDIQKSRALSSYRNKPLFIKITQSLVLPHSHRYRMRVTSLLDCYRPLSVANLFSFKSLPVQPNLPIANSS